jgi:YgiT-type zinc finger domain-containing protein
LRGKVAEQTVDYDYRRPKKTSDGREQVSAGVCRQCGEKYFKPDILKRMDSVYHSIFEATKSHNGR